MAGNRRKYQPGISGLIFIILIFYFMPAGITLSQNLPGDISHLMSISENLNAPVRIALGPDGNIYVTDAYRHSIIVFNPDGEFEREISLIEIEPVSLAVNSDGELFIGDGISGGIYRYEGNGNSSIFYSGTYYPNTMRFDKKDQLYIADSGRKNIVIVDISSNQINEFGEDLLEFPTGIALDEVNQKIFIAEHGGSGSGFSPLVKIHIFNLDGSFIKSFGSHGNGDGQFYRIQGMTIGKCGFLYAIDPYLGRISIFDHEGIFVSSFGDWGEEAGQLNLPMDIVFGSRQQFIITSMNNGRLETFTVNDSLPTANILTPYFELCAGGNADLEISFTGTAPWNFTYTRDGIEPVTLTASQSPFYLNISQAGFYQIIDINDAASPGSCYTGGALVETAAVPPTAHIRGDAEICEGERTDLIVEFTGEGPWTFTYTRNGQEPKTIRTTNNPHVVNTVKAGVFELSELLTGSCGGNEVSGRAEVIVHPKPSAAFLDGNELISKCELDKFELSVELSGEAPWDIIYSIDDKETRGVSDIQESRYKLAAYDPGTYDIKVVMDKHCFNTVSQGFPEIVNVPGPAANIEPYYKSICRGETEFIPVDLSGTPPWTIVYQYNDLALTTVRNIMYTPYKIRATAGGTYRILDISDAECSGNDLNGFVIIDQQQLPIALFSYLPDAQKVSFQNESEFGRSYLWDFGDGTTSKEQDPIHYFNSPGEYIVSLTTSNESCGSDIYTDTIRVSSVSTEITELENLVKIYPNPSEGRVIFELSRAFREDVTIDILNLNGQVIYSEPMEHQETRKEIDLSRYSKGLYLIRIFSKDYLKSGKLILN